MAAPVGRVDYVARRYPSPVHGLKDTPCLYNASDTLLAAALGPHFLDSLHEMVQRRGRIQRLFYFSSLNDGLALIFSVLVERPWRSGSAVGTMLNDLRNHSDQSGAGGSAGHGVSRVLCPNAVIAA